MRKRDTSASGAHIGSIQHKRLYKETVTTRTSERKAGRWKTACPLSEGLRVPTKQSLPGNAVPTPRGRKNAWWVEEIHQVRRRAYQPSFSLASIPGAPAHPSTGCDCQQSWHSASPCDSSDSSSGSARSSRAGCRELVSVLVLPRHQGKTHPSLVFNTRHKLLLCLKTRTRSAQPPLLHALSSH